MKLISVSRIGPDFLTHAIDRSLIQLPEIARSLRIEPATLKHRTRATFFERRVVEIRVWPSVEYLLRKRRRFDDVTREQVLLVTLDRRQQSFETVDVHRFFETVFHCLIYERMRRDLSFAGRKVFGASDLIGEDGSQQIFRVHALQLRRDLFAA